MSTNDTRHAGDDVHYLLSEKDVGICRRLTGQVTLAVIFVSTPDCAWDAHSQQAMTETIRTAMDRVTADAAAYGAHLDLGISTFAVTAKKLVYLKEKHVDWVRDILDSNAALPPFRIGKNEQGMPLLFCLPGTGRAFASANYSPDIAEYSIAYQDSSVNTIRHELMHLYGAPDFYFHDDVRQAAEKYLPNSIMLIFTEEARVDDLTAYLLGWTETLSPSAESFLAATKHVTHEMFCAALRENTRTGYFRVVTDTGVYTGMLKHGWKHGWGRMEWANGDVYEGQWANGCRNGYGVYTWKNGTVYAGEYLNSQQTGQGVYTWAEGRYTGSFLNNQKHGSGILTWNCGDTYAGTFLHGERTGQGMYTWKSGSTYTGEFLNGELHGQGLYTMADGNTYTGGFQNGKFHGWGVYTWKDGSTYTGEGWSGKYHGQGVLVDKNGQVTQGTWKQGIHQP